MSRLKQYKITAKEVNYLNSCNIFALNRTKAKEKFKEFFESGRVLVGSSEIQFQEIKREEVKE
jgi:hypothetical protein